MVLVGGLLRYNELSNTSINPENNPTKWPGFFYAWKIIHSVGKAAIEDSIGESGLNPG
mgnify:CR=1 FL=1